MKVSNQEKENVRFELKIYVLTYSQLLKKWKHLSTPHANSISLLKEDTLSNRGSKFRNVLKGSVYTVSCIYINRVTLISIMIISMCSSRVQKV